MEPHFQKDPLLQQSRLLRLLWHEKDGLSNTDVNLAHANRKN